MLAAISLTGLFVIIGLAWLMSSHRRSVNLRVIAGGMLLQFVLAIIVLKTGPGQWLFSSVGDLVTRLLDFVDAGARSVRPELSRVSFRLQGSADDHFLFVADVGDVLLRHHAMGDQNLCRGHAARDGYVGGRKPGLGGKYFRRPHRGGAVIRPYISSMTSSELMAVMVGGFANAAGGVMAVYIGMGMSAGHLLTASLISAPASLLLAKVMEPSAVSRSCADT